MKNDIVRRTYHIHNITTGMHCVARYGVSLALNRWHSEPVALFKAFICNIDKFGRPGDEAHTRQDQADVGDEVVDQKRSETLLGELHSDFSCC